MDAKPRLSGEERRVRTGHVITPSCRRHVSADFLHYVVSKYSLTEQPAGLRRRGPLPREAIRVGRGRAGLSGMIPRPSTEEWRSIVIERGHAMKSLALLVSAVPGAHPVRRGRRSQAGRDGGSGKDGDEKAIRSLIAQLAEDWEKRDMKPFTSRFRRRWRRRQSVRPLDQGTGRGREAPGRSPRLALP